MIYCGVFDLHFCFLLFSSFHHDDLYVCLFWEICGYFCDFFLVIDVSSGRVLTISYWPFDFQFWVCFLKLFVKTLSHFCNLVYPQYVKFQSKTEFDLRACTLDINSRFFAQNRGVFTSFFESAHSLLITYNQFKSTQPNLAKIG